MFWVATRPEGDSDPVWAESSGDLEVADAGEDEMALGDSSRVVEVEAVSKRFGRQLVLDDVNLTVPARQICGISGPNGAGKSMLLRVISGLVRPTDGRVAVFGERIGTDVEFPRDTGVLIETPGFLRNYSGIRNLELLAMIRNRVTREEIAATIALVGLDPDDRRAVRTYSTGMRQRLGIAQALMERPELLILDEPTKGVDRDGVRLVHDLLRDVKSKGVTVLLTTHSREELHDLCDAAYLMDGGRLTAYEGGPATPR